jgi:hypothetical protein
MPATEIFRKLKTILKTQKVREPTMTKLEKGLYIAKAPTTGDASRTDDGQSAIFRSVIKLAAGKKKVPRNWLDAAEQLRGLR